MIWNPWKTIRELELKIRNLSGQILVEKDYIIQLNEKIEVLEETIDEQLKRIKELTNKIYKQKQELKNNKMKWS